MRLLEKTLILIMSTILPVAKLAMGVHAGDDELKSPGAHALRFQKTPQYWIDQRFSLFDGFISNDQAQSKQYDRRVGLGLGLGVEQPLAPVFSIRIDARGELIKRRQMADGAAGTTSDETYLWLRPLAAATYITPAGLEIFGGAVWNILPSHTQTIQSGVDKTVIKRKTTHFMAPHVGLTRRGGIGSGGIYYQFGREQKREVIKHGADGTILEMSEIKHEPTTLGVFAQFSGAASVWRVEGAAVSAGDGGELTESGESIRDDHLELAVSSLWNATFDAGVAYQTARYAKSAYMDLDSIPMTSAHVYAMSGEQAKRIYVGVVGAMGRDKQSIPEMNARYEVNAFSLVGGVYGSF